MKKLTLILLLSLSIPAFAHDLRAPEHVAVALPASVGNSVNITAGSTLGVAMCDGITNGRFSGNRFVCGMGVLLINAMRNNPNMDAAAVGVGAGTLISWKWEF